MLAAFNGTKIKRRLPLYEYQLDGCDKVEEAWEEFPRALGACATGGGKSLLAGEIIARQVERGNRCLMLAHQRSLVDQFAFVTERDFGIWSTVEMGGRRSEESPLVCATTQTMVSRIRNGDMNPEDFSVVIWDESHHCSSNTHQEIAKAFPHAKHLGITATPVASGQRDLMKWFDVKAFDIKLTWLIENGYLCRLENLNIPINIRVDDSEIRAGDFKEEQIGSAIDPYLEGCSEWLATAPEAQGRACLIFQPLIRTSKRFTELLLKRGLKAAHIDGTMNDEERKRILRDFALGNITHLSNSMLLTEGVDMPWVNLILNLRLTRSWTLFVQIIGRGTRLFDPAKNGLKGTTWPKKESCLIVDPLWQCDEINPMKLPNLVSADEEEAKAIEAVMRKQMAGGKKGDLMAAIGDLKALKEEQLAQRMAANAKKKARFVDCVEFFSRCHMPELVDYEPLNDTEARPAASSLTEKQKSWLEKSRFQLDGICYGQAKKILDTLGERAKNRKGTVAQIKYSISLGYPEDKAWEADFDTLSAYIEKNKPEQPWMKYRSKK